MVTFQSAIIMVKKNLKLLLFTQQTNEKHRKNMYKSESAKCCW